MNRVMILHLPPKQKILVYIQLLWVMVMLWLRDVVGLPSAITYATDIFTVCLLIQNINRIRRNVRIAKTTSQSKILLGIVCAIVLGIVLNFVRPLLVLWAIRNNLRFFAFFYICIGVLDKWDIDCIFAMLIYFFWANVIMCTYQYFALNLSGDYLGGFFGVIRGCNGYMNVLLCGVTAIIFGRYFAGNIKLSSLSIYCIACVYIAILSELKAYYIELIIIAVVAMISAGVSWRFILLSIMGAMLIPIMLLVLNMVDPDSLMVLTDTDALEIYLAGNGYTQKGDLNRFTALQRIYDMFFAEQPLRSLLGFGFGSCEWSQFSFLQSPFFLRYGYLRYRWFTHAWVFLEQGAIGLSLLAYFFVSIILDNAKRKSIVRKKMYITSACFVPTCILGMIYNCSIQLEACYIIAFMCAIPFIEFKTFSQQQIYSASIESDTAI